MNQVLKELISHIELPPDQLEDQDSEIVEIFIEEVEEILNFLDEALPQWLQKPNDEELLTEIRRSFHTLKGSGRMAGAKQSGELAWAIEEMLNRVMDKTNPLTVAMQELTYSVRMVYNALVEYFKTGQDIGFDFRPWIVTANRLRDRKDIEPQLQYCLSYYKDQTIPSDDEIAFAEVAVPAESVEAAEAVAETAEVELAGVEYEDDPTFDIFIEESLEHLETINHFLHIDGEPSVDEFNQLVRALHTIRGSSGMVGMDSLFTASSEVEQLYKHLEPETCNSDAAYGELLLEYYEYVKSYIDVLQNHLPKDKLLALDDQFQQVWQVFSEHRSTGEEGATTAGVVSQLLELDVNTLLDAEFCFIEEIQQHFKSYLQELLDQTNLLLAHATSKQTESLRVVASQLQRCYYAMLNAPEVQQNEDILQRVKDLHQYLIEVFDGLAAGQSVVISELAKEEFEQVIHDIADWKETAEATPTAPTTQATTSEAASEEPVAEPANTEFDADMLDIFLEELEELVANMDHDFDVWESNPSDTEVLHNLFRYLHTLKGGANMVQATHLGKLAHGLESVYDHVLKGQIHPTAQDMTFIRYAQDEIATRLQRLRDEQIDEADPQLLAQIHALLDGQTAAAVPQVTATVQESAPQVQETVQTAQATTPEAASEEPVAEPANTEFDADMLDIFLEESEELVANMDHDFDVWESNPSDTEVLHNLFRYLHTLKGGANMVQATHLGKLAHGLESVYDHVLKGQIHPTAQDMTFIRYAQDEIAIRLQRLRDEQIDEADPQLLAQIHALLGGTAPVAPAETSTPTTTVPTVEPAVQHDEPRAVVKEEMAAEPQASSAAPANTEFDADMLDIFLEESDELVANMDRDFAVWESNPSDTDILHNLFRYLHTLKGGANMVQATYLGTIAHGLESVYDHILKGQIQPSAQDMTLIRYVQDEIATRLQRLRDEHIDQADEALLAQIQQLLGHEVAAPAVKAVEPEHAVISEKPAQPVVKEKPQPAPVKATPVQATAPEKPAVAVVSAPAEAEATLSAEQWTQVQTLAAEQDISPILAKAMLFGDEQDVAIVECYLDEAYELLDQGESTFAKWMGMRTDRNLLLILQRTYHTLKGSSRLIQEEMIAKVAYQLEVVFEQYSIQQFTLDRYDDLLRKAQQWLRDAVSKGQLDGVDQLLAQLHSISYQKVIVEQAEPIFDQEQVVLIQEEEVVEGDGSTPPEMYPAVVEVQEQQTQEQIRISAELVEKMIDLSGESAINRSRIELDLGQMNFTLSEMELAIQRLADQLRRMEGELEAQILAKHQDETRYADFDPLEMDQYSSLNQLSKSLAESASDLLDFKATLADKIRDTENLLLQQSRIQNELQSNLMGTRLVPFSRLVPRLQRLVRQISVKLDRPAMLNVENTEGELDRNILERLIAPLEHMLRNAIDHGIESSQERVKLGKPSVGNINLNITREGNDILVIFSDDGHGIDVDAVRKKAINNGLITPDMNISDEDVMQYIFHSGLSTAKQVTQISGRGVGLDVVQTDIKALGGIVSVKSALGKGTEFTIRVPTTVSVSDALMVKIGEQQFALPLGQIERIVRVSPVALAEYYASQEENFEIDGVSYRMRYMGEFVTGVVTPKLTNMGSSVPVIIYSSSGRSVALQVDQLVGSRAQIVVKPLGQQLSSINYLSGVTILADGRVCLILDSANITRQVLTTSRAHQLQKAVIHHEEVFASRKVIMVVDDSVTVRKVTTRLLERQGFDVVTAKDGLDAVEKLSQHKPDLMLLDIEMPRMDGFEVLNYVRHDEHYQNLPVIMITSRTGEKHRERAFSLGVSQYMGKPFQEADLLSNIRALLGMEALS